MTKQEKQSIKSQLITINWLAGTCAVLTSLFWIVIFSSIAFLITHPVNNPTPPTTTPIVPVETTPSFLTIFFFLFSSFMFWISIIVGPILNLVAAVIILATDWKLNELQQNKLLWGLLAIFLLGFIALFVFSISSSNVLKKVKVENEDNYNKYI